eukprot:1161819-Pelagomonas_calceolata.AAC.2
MPLTLIAHMCGAAVLELQRASNCRAHRIGCRSAAHTHVAAVLSLQSASYRLPFCCPLTCCCCFERAERASVLYQLPFCCPLTCCCCFERAERAGATCQLLFYNGKVISVDPPTFVDLEIVECPPNVKGNTASGAIKKKNWVRYQR